MESNIEILQRLRKIAILSKSNLQFGLTSLLLRLEYGDFEEEQHFEKPKNEELLLH